MVICSLSMVAVVQSVERQIVILVVVGSSPIGHPIFQFELGVHLGRRYAAALFLSMTACVVLLGCSKLLDTRK